MTTDVYAGDDALYTPRKGEPVMVRVMRHTAKRVAICIPNYTQKRIGNSPAVDVTWTLRYVKPERLEARGGVARCG